MRKKTSKAQQAEDLERARNQDGTYKGDDPATTDVNEAWVSKDATTLEQIDGAMRETAEAVEPAQPAGVVTTEQRIQRDDAAPTAYVVQTTVKHNGYRYNAGDQITGLSVDDAVRMLRSGSIRHIQGRDIKE